MNARPIDKLSVAGFKSIRNLRDLELRPLNILIGANGSGKSNFIQFFQLLREMMDGRLQLAVKKAGGADTLLFLGPQVTEQIAVSIHFGPNGYGFALEPTADGRLVFSREVIRSEGDDYRSKHSDQNLGVGHEEAKLPEETMKGPTGSAPNEVFHAVSSWVVYHFHDTSDTAAVKRRGTVRDNAYLRPNAGNLAAFLLRIQQEHPNTYALIRDTVRLIAPFFDDFQLRPRETPNGDTLVELEWRQKHSDYPFHPSQLSDGTLRFICLTTALLQPEPPATMLFDEPELGLHPEALHVLAGLLKQATERTQIIVATQSAPLIDYFAPEDIVVIDRKDGESFFRRLTHDELREWLQEYTLGELWQKNVISGGPVHE